MGSIVAKLKKNKTVHDARSSKNPNKESTRHPPPLPPYHSPPPPALPPTHSPYFSLKISWKL